MGMKSRSIRTKSVKLASVATIALLHTPVIFAQATDDEIELDEIVVTAQQREQNIQDVPISIQVVSDRFIEDLAADNISDISQFIPGLDVSAQSPTQPRYTIRGVTTSDFGVGTDPAVGVYVDGVYAARSGAAVLSFGDIERIEVLKGPQGTLFGRNAAAGAVSIITKKPSQELEAQLSGRFGNYGKRRLEAMGNIPITDTLALRVNGLYNERDGIFEDAATGQDLSREDNWATRASLRWDMASTTDATVTWTHDELDQDARPAIGIIAVPAAPGQPPVPADPTAFINPFNAPVFNDVIDNHETRNLDEVTLTINHDFGNMVLTSISSWRDFTTENREDEDGTNRIDLYFDTNNIESNESFFQELRLSGDTGSVNWLIGASYYDEQAEQASDTFTFTDTVNTTLGNIGLGTPFSDLENFVLIPNNVPATLLGHGWRETIFNEGDFKAFAIYADAIWAINDRLNLTVGGRYTRDEKRFQWLNGPREAPELDATLQALDDLGILGLAGVSPANFQFDLVFDQSALGGIACGNGVNVAEGVECVLDRSWDNFSPRAVLDYKIDEGVLAFASFAKGYKAGGFNSVQIASEFDNEDVTSYEVGIKSEFPDSGLLLNVSAFHYVYNDKQAIRLSTPPGGNVPQYLVETSDDQAWGADLQLVYAVSENFDLFGNAQYIDATFKNRIAGDGTDLEGQPTGEPKFSASFGARFEQELDGGSRVAFQVVHAYRGAERSNSESIAQGALSATDVFEVGGEQNRTDLRFTWLSASGRFELGMYANNVFDNRYVTGINNLTAATLGTPFVGITEPMFWGGDFKIRF